jgi:heme exporter protein D
MSGFWAMGGYAAYVWPAYGISAAALAIAAWLTWRAWRRAVARIAALEARKTP